LAALTGAKAFIEDRLFATLDTMTRELELDGRRDPRRNFALGERAGPAASAAAESAVGAAEVARVRLVDTVGFIRKLPHHLVASFRATLEEARDADILLHVIDASHPDWEEQLQVVDEVLAGLARRDALLIHVFNKVDRLGDPQAFRSLVASRYPNAVLVSALRGEVEDLRRALELAAEPAGLER
jgi:GTP-binding protein HflX